MLAEVEPLFLRPANIASRRFTRSMNGYDPEEVEQFLEDVADYLSRLEGELEWRRARRGRQPGTIGEQEEAVRVVASAREQAERLLAEARKEAEGYVKLARAIAHQLALEAQARRPHIAMAITRASGSSTTVEGNQEFEDLEVWIDTSVFDLTKTEEPQTSDDVVTGEEPAQPEIVVSDDTNLPPATEAPPTVEAAPAIEEPPTVEAPTAIEEPPVATTASDPAPSHTKTGKKSKKFKKTKKKS